jgi:hypothetical protein
MIPALRKAYNEAFTKERYEEYIRALEGIYPGHLDFRVAETPLFISKAFTQKLLSACDSIIEAVTSPQYLEQSFHAIPPDLRVPNDDAQPHCLALDFGICIGQDGELEPQLIELQGFPSLFAWQVLLPEVHQKVFGAPEGFSAYLGGLNRDSYLQLLRTIVIGDEAPEHVVLLEILPHQQKTRVDFYATRELLGIEVVCLTEVEQEGKQLFYRKEGKRIPIRRIYNRVIFDELLQQPEAIREKGKIFQQDLEVTWVPHPNWFYRISKYSLPFIDHPFVPKTVFLSDARPWPSDLENYVAKPLFSFAGQGVIIDVTANALDAIRDPENWILQRKVPYAAAIDTPDEKAKAEIRLFFLWEPGSPAPVAATNLCRLSKGKMVGVRYNKDKEWVGGSFCLFER